MPFEHNEDPTNEEPFDLFISKFEESKQLLPSVEDQLVTHSCDQTIDIP